MKPDVSQTTPPTLAVAIPTSVDSDNANFSNLTVPPNGLKLTAAFLSESYSLLYRSRTLTLEHQLALLDSQAAPGVIRNILIRNSSGQRQPSEILATEVESCRAHEIRYLQNLRNLVDSAQQLFEEKSPRTARVELKEKYLEAEALYGPQLVFPRHYRRMQQMLTPAEQVNIADLVSTLGGMRSELGERFMPLVYSIVYEKYQNGPLSALDDCYQEGFFTLMSCLAGFKPERGYSFRSYLTRSILNRLWVTLAADRQTIATPGHIRIEWVPIYNEAQQRFQVPKPNLQQIAEVGQCSLVEAQNIIRGVELRELSIRIIHNHDEDKGRYLQFQDEGREAKVDSRLEGLELRSQLDLALRALSKHKPRLVDILVARFGLRGTEPADVAEVANRMGYSRDYVRQLQFRALKLLRSYSVLRGLRA